MKLNVLIVDDEPIVCKGLRQTVPWDELEVNIVGEAYDGEEALEMMEQQEIDLILSDIRMPGMDGLELARQVFCRFPHIRMVILSGYDEFEYAKKAIRLGVKDYLLKPVDIDELMAIVLNIKKECDKERKKEWRITGNQLLSAIVLGHDLDVHQEFFKLSSNENYQLIASSIENYSSTVQTISKKEEQEKIKQNWVQLIEDSLNHAERTCTSLFISKNCLLIFCKNGHRIPCNKQIFYEVMEKAKRQLGVSLFFCLSRPFEQMKEIHVEYQNVLEGLKAFPIMEENVYDAADIQKKQRNVVDIPDEYVQRLKQFNDFNDFDKLYIIVDQIFEYFRENHYLLDDVASALQDLENKLFDWMPNKPKLRFNEEMDVGIYNSYDELKKLFIHDLEDYFSYHVTATKIEQRRLVDKAMNYIKEHYAEDLKAAEIAKLINISPNYFSLLIKQATGKHFNELLNEIRINHAKSLLKETNYKIFQIGEMVGYKNYKYFVQIFKKLTSVSPSKFRCIAVQADLGRKE